MKGIYPEGRCPTPKCNKTFKWHSQRGFVCPKHLSPATRYSIVIYYKGQRIKRGTTLDSKTLKTFADAHGLLMQAKKEKNNHTFDPRKWNSKERIDFKFSQLLWQWYEEKERQMKQGKLAYGYVPKLKGYMKNYYEPFVEDIDVREIFNLKPFANKLPLTLSLKYQKNIIDALIGFFRWLRKNRYISELPVFPDPIDVPEYEPQTVSREIQDKYLELVAPVHLPIFTFLIYQGARPSEVAALMGDCIQGDTVTYKRNFSNRKFVEHTKNKSVRYNYIFPQARAVLPKVFPNQFVFTHGISKRPYSNDFLNQIHKKTLKAFKEEYGTNLNIPLYEFTKHSFGTQFINEHPDKERLLQEHFGHSRPEMTKRYAKMKVVDAFRKLDNVTPLRRVNGTSN